MDSEDYALCVRRFYELEADHLAIIDRYEALKNTRVDELNGEDVVAELRETMLELQQSTELLEENRDRMLAYLKQHIDTLIDGPIRASIINRVREKMSVQRSSTK